VRRTTAHCLHIKYIIIVSSYSRRSKMEPPIDFLCLCFISMHSEQLGTIIIIQPVNKQYINICAETITKTNTAIE